MCSHRLFVIPAKTGTLVLIDFLDAGLHWKLLLRPLG